MALTADEQKLFDLALSILPHWFQDDKRAMEHLGLCAKEAGAGWTQLVDWMDNALILQAVGATGSDPDWLNQHAIDRGSTRQSGESDAALRERIRNVPDLLTRQILIDAAQAIVDAQGVAQDQQVEWVSAVNVNASSGSITKNAGGAAWNAGAISQERIMKGEDGYVAWQIGQNDKSAICGLNYRSGGETQAEIDFGLQTDSTGMMKVYENGAEKTLDYDGDGSYSVFDDFRVSVDDDVVTYWHKPSAGSWTLLYTSDASPSYPLRADASIYDVGSSIDDVVISQPVRMNELRRDKAYLGGDFTSDSETSTGHKIYGTAPDMEVERDSDDWDRPPHLQDSPFYGYQIVLANFATGGNNGTFVVTSLNGDRVQYQNASGAAEVDASADSSAQKLDQDGNLADGYNRAYLSRGYRMGHGNPNTIIMILPYGSTAATVASIEEMLRQKKAAGIIAYVERRQNP